MVRPAPRVSSTSTWRSRKARSSGSWGPTAPARPRPSASLLDLIRATSGRALLFGIVSSVDPVAIHRRVGYLPGEFALYDRLTGGQTLEYFANLRGGVDPAYQRSLIERFDLDCVAPLPASTPKGNKQKVGLVIALQHKPELLILDEPTSGLDPLVQQTFFETMREAVEGRQRPSSCPATSCPRSRRCCDRVADHPRGQPGEGGQRRRPPRPRPSPGGAAVRRIGAHCGVRGNFRASAISWPWTTSSGCGSQGR